MARAPKKTKWLLTRNQTPSERAAKRKQARVDAAVSRAVAKQRAAFKLDSQFGPGQDKRPNIDRAREYGRRATDLLRRAQLARARGDTQLADSLMDAAKRARRVAAHFHRLHKRNDAKRSIEGEHWDAREKYWRARERALRKEGRDGEADDAHIRAESSGMRADEARKLDGVPVKKRRDKKEIEGLLSKTPAGRAFAAAQWTRERAERAAARKAEFDASPAGVAKAKRAAIKARRRDIRARMAQERRRSYGLGHTFSKARAAEIVAAKQARVLLNKLEEQVQKEHLVKMAKKREAASGKPPAPPPAPPPVPKGRLRIHEQRARLDGLLKENKDEAKALRREAREAVAEAKAARAAMRAASAARGPKNERVPGSVTERNWADAVAKVEQTSARAASVKQRITDNKTHRDAVASVRTKVEQMHERSFGQRVQRVLSAPGRRLQRLQSTIATKFREFKKKHGIDKPLKPDQRKTLMQKLFGSDKGYRGEAYVAGGMGGVGMMFLTGRAGFQHPDHRVKMRELSEEMKHAHEEVPHVLHKGSKGGVFYYSPEGKKVYIVRGGLRGMIGAIRMAGAGFRGARLYR